MATGFVSGYATGYAQSDEKTENPKMHGVLWGSVAAALVGATALYLHDDNQEIQNLNLKIVSLERDLEVERFGAKNKIDEGSSHLYEKELPRQLQSLVKAGEWQLFEVDEWKKARDGVLVHHDKLFRFIEPKIKLKK